MENTEKLRIIQELVEEKLASLPFFVSHVDQSGSIFLDHNKSLYDSYQIEKLLNFCNKRKLDFQIFTSKIDPRVIPGEIAIALYEKGE